MNTSTLGYTLLSAMQELSDEFRWTRAEMQANRECLEKLRQDLRMAYFDSTTCGNCGAGFEYPVRIAGKETVCPQCTAIIRLPH